MSTLTTLPVAPAHAEAETAVTAGAAHVLHALLNTHAGLPDDTVPDTFTDAAIQQSLGVNAATLVYGDTGSGKTTLAATAAEYIYERSAELFGTDPKNRRIMRLYAADSGGYPTRVQALMKMGIIETWRMRNHAEPFAACELASLGYWPIVIDRNSGQATSSVKLLPPVITSLELFCPNGHPVKTVYSPKAILATLCPHCRINVTEQTMRIRRTQMLNPSFVRVGGVFVDGLTSWTDWIMGDMAQRTADNKLDGEKSALGGVIVSDGMKFGQNNRAHFGFAQTRAQFWCSNLATIPHLIVPPICTALEDRGSDEAKAPIYGPKVAGSAKTSHMPSWVGNCLRTAVVKNAANQAEWRLYLRQHSFAHEGFIPHLAKTRSESDLLPEYLADVDEANKPLPRFTRFSLNYFFRKLDEVLTGTMQEYAEKYTPYVVQEEALAPDLLAALTNEVTTAPSTIPSAQAPGQAIAGARAGARAAGVLAPAAQPVRPPLPARPVPTPGVPPTPAAPAPAVRAPQTPGHAPPASLGTGAPVSPVQAAPVATTPVTPVPPKPMAPGTVLPGARAQRPAQPPSPPQRPAVKPPSA